MGAINKLPVKATTKHVPHPVLPEKGINSNLQQKVTDKNGVVRFISRKSGMVMGDSGVPVKPPKRV